MSNEHIGRLQKIGLGKESTSGTAVAVSVWIPKSGGVLTPKYTTQEDPSAYGVIDAIKDVETTKALTEIDIEGEPRDKWFGHILTAAFGSAYSCVKHPISSISGTFTEGETITESTSSATGTLRRNDQGAGTPVLYIVPVSGTFVGGGKTLTGGTSGATATNGTIESPSAVRFHVFRRLNSNTPVTYTIYNNDPLTDERAAFCALDSLEIEVVSGQWAKFTSKWMGKMFSSTSAQSPSYTSENPFLAKNATAKLASAFNSLDAASAVSIERMKLTISKNLTDFQAFGSTDVTSFHNQQFEVKGDFTLLYNATTQRDYLTNSTNQALRLTLANSAVTIGSSASPTLQFDMPSCAFTEWSRTNENNGIVKQTLSFAAEFDITRSLTLEAILANTQTTAY